MITLPGLTFRSLALLSMLTPFALGLVKLNVANL